MSFTHCAFQVKIIDVRAVDKEPGIPIRRPRVRRLQQHPGCRASRQQQQQQQQHWSEEHLLENSIFIGDFLRCDIYSMALTAHTILVLLAAHGQQPLEPPNARMCPFFAAEAGTASAYHPAARSCPSIAAMRRWKKMKFGLFMHWGPFAQRVPYDNQYPGASWKLNYWTAGGT